MYLNGTDDIDFHTATNNSPVVQGMAWGRDINEESGEVTYWRSLVDQGTDGTTAVQLVPAVFTDAGKERTVRLVDGFSFYNADDAAATITVHLNAKTIGAFTIQTKEHLNWTPANGWQVLSVAGAIS